ncbi:similar to Mycobacterium phage TM4 NP_569822.1 [Mycobacterium phage TM4] [Geotrichum candidum]|uniref:Similar to Mycobacterium phage TM4 NP_569822.1 [Mycobacterium phage TM4] n=1 Tax=Geotrichum candidum TaxID=1173061 RepID=A0A0J9XH80_GEOCN|nr:similar to Mycobacterium phage TM4 NP_569822.1 [Mycobacterium phage TM4] [Geotrichum candidum]
MTPKTSASLKRVPLVIGISAIAGFIFTRQVLYTPSRKGATPVERSGGGI